MELELKGKVIKVLPQQTGTGAKGNWVSQEFVIETDDRYPKSVCFRLFNDKCDFCPSKGDNVTVSFNVESREYNDRWYTSLNAWKITGGSKNTFKDPELNNKKEQISGKLDLVQEETDDLPF